MNTTIRMRQVMGALLVSLVAGCGGGGGGGAAPTQQLTVVKAGTGSGAVTSVPAGVDCGSSCVAAFDQGATVTLSAAAANGSVFAGWSGACSGSAAQASVALDAARSCTATFTALRALGLSLVGSGGGTVTSAPSGISCGWTCNFSFVDGTSVTLTAAPASSSAFVQWGGECTGNALSTTISLTAARGCTARFELLFTLAVTRSGTGNGTVASAPAGIDCGTSCSAEWLSGSAVSLTSSAADGSSFVGWSGDCSGNGPVLAVAMAAARNCNAQFDVLPPAPVQHALSIAKTGDGGGTVTSAPAGINCGTTCTANFNQGTGVTLSAAPAAGSGFTGWSGDCSGAAPTTSVAVSAPRSCGASFLLLPATPTLQIAYALKRFDFSWPAAARATHYRLLEQASTAAAFAQLGADLTLTSTSKDIAVHRIDWPAIAYKLQACNAAGCSESAVVSASPGMLPTIGYVKASNTGVADEFGYSMALSADGNTMAVGAPQEDSNATGIGGDQSNNAATRAGAVYVFARVNGTWAQQAYVKGSNARAGDSFGWAVALSADGSTMAVGAVDADPAGVPSAGSAYVFVRSGAAWTEQAILSGPSTSSGNFGWSIALSSAGDTLAVGARGDGGSGTAFIYARTGSTWTQQAALKASNAGSSDLFGAAVALSSDGSTLAVGAPQEASNATGINGDQANNAAAAAGAAYVFTRIGAAWSQQAYVKASNTGSGDLFGSAVSLVGDGNTLAIGAPGERSSAVGLNGDQANNSAGGSGAVYLFARTGTAWCQAHYVKASNRSGSFGGSVAFSADGSAFAVGATIEQSSAVGINGSQALDSSASGAAYAFVRNGASWLQQAYVKAPNTAVNDNFGRVVAMSSDGSTLAVSAEFEDSNATGINGDRSNDAAGNSGAVYLY